ncbi:MAG: beta strand repeat-containing protein, partial [Bacteroidota bacterium]
MKKTTCSVIFDAKKLKKLFLFLTVVLFLIPSYSYSTHIVGGELNYRCLGGNQYQIKLRVYRDCYTGVPPFDNPAAVGIFDVNNVLITTVYLNFPGSTVLPPTVAQANVCVKTPTNICVEVAEYVGTVTLPPRVGGYQLAYQRCCRNPTVDNIINPGNQGATYYARIPDQAVACNSNPVFTNWPPIFVCANNQILFDHSATDAEGDVIVYSLCSPFDGGTANNAQPNPPSAPPYSPIIWKAPYSATNPLGGNTLTIDPNTGLMTGTPTTLGQFVVGVCADEYRNGVLISTTKRDFQFNVINCQPDIVAASTYAVTNCTNYTVTFTNNSTGTNNFFWNFGDTGTLSDTSRVKDPTYIYPGVGTYTVTLIAFSGINPSCNDTLNNFVVNVTPCPPCTMTLGMSKTDATCGSSGATGCAHILDTVPCSGTVFMGNYGNGGSASSSCGSGITGTNNVGTPSGTTPTSITVQINGVTVPAPTSPPHLTITGDPLATCPKTARAIKYANGTVAFDYYLWLGSAATPGSATVTPSGGTGPYTYSWVPSGGNAATANGLTAGTYTVTVTDGTGCQRTGSVIINSTSAMTVTTGFTSPTSCSASNGTASVTASGGTGPYTYLWSNGQTNATATGLSAGVYTVNVGDNGCSVTTTITVNPPITLTVNTSRTHATCNGDNGTAAATASGGSGTYTYLWGNGQTTAAITALTAGTYTVTATDAGNCKGTAAVNINNNSLALASSHTNPNCGGTTGGTASMTATNGTGAYTYYWNTAPVQSTASVTGLQGGSYVGTVVDGAGCTDTVQVTINEPPQLLPEPKNTSTISCAGVQTGSAHVDVSGGTAGFTYFWSNGQTTQSITGLSAGTYTITVTDSRGCTGRNSVNVALPSPLSLAYFPSNVTGCNGGNNGSVTVNPSGGNPGYTYSWNTSPVKTTQSITGLSAGTYTVVVTDITGCTASLNNVVISQPSTISLSTSSVPVGCTINNGSASVTAGGGTPGFTYSWSNGVTTSSSITGLSAGTYSVTVTDANGCTGITSVNVANAGAPTIGISGPVTNVGCTGSATGSATVTATGGTGTLTYSWNNGVTSTTGTASGLTSGSYIVTVTDANGCTAQQTVAITQPASAVNSGIAGQANVNCTGSATGTATVTASGGTPSYTYNWSTGVTTSNSVSGLTAGTYSVTITDNNGCTRIQTVTITQPVSAISANASATNAICGGSNGTASVTASGGTGAYIYSWSTAPVQTSAMATGLSSGSYNVTVTDANGCTGVTSVSVNNAGGPTVGISGAVTNVSCTGNATGSATVTATGGTAPLTYSWNNGVTSTTGTASGLTAGTYIVTVTDVNGCAQGQTVNITQPAAALGGIITSSNIGCTGAATGSATVTGTNGTPGYTYAWSTGVTTSNSVSGLTVGTYSVIITDNNGCTNQQTVTITQPAAALTAIAGGVNAACGGSNGSVTVTASGGTTNYIYTWSTGGTDATIINLTAGTYTVLVTDANGCTNTATASVGNSAGPTVGISTQGNVNCRGAATGNVTITATGGTGVLTYTWNNGVTSTTGSAGGLTAGTYTVVINDANNCSQQQLVTITEPSSSISVVSDSTNAACGNSNGTVSITATGGTPGYTYNWSTGATTGNSLTGLTAGTYSVTVTDNNGCTKATTIKVAGSPGPTAGVSSQSNITCNGLTNGSATVTVSSGTLPYTYTWNPNVTNNSSSSTLSAATYTVIVSDSANCRDTAYFTITEPLPITFTLSVSS